MAITLGMLQAKQDLHYAMQGWSRRVCDNPKCDWHEYMHLMPTYHKEQDVMHATYHIWMTTNGLPKTRIIMDWSVWHDKPEKPLGNACPACYQVIQMLRGE